MGEPEVKSFRKKLRATDIIPAGRGLFTTGLQCTIHGHRAKQTTGLEKNVVSDYKSDEVDPMFN